MTSLQEIQVALQVKVCQHRMGRLESAATHKDVAGMLAAVTDLERKAKELREQLEIIYNSPGYMNGGEGGIENT